MSRSPVAVSTAPAAKNSRLLNSEWLSTCSSAAVKASAAAGGHAVGLEGEREAQADEDDADVLDRAVGEQPLEVALHQGAEHAEHGADAADRQHHDAPPPGRRAHQIEHDAHEAVDRDLGHDAAHQRGDVTGRGRMGERQPHVQRHQAGLGASSQQRPAAGRARAPTSARRHPPCRRTCSCRRGPRAGRRPAAAPACRSSPS